MNRVRQYFSDVKATLDSTPITAIEETINILHEARIMGGRVFIMGNGGSASTATHFVCDLAKNTRQIGWPNFKVIGLTDNMAWFSALANDEGYESVFAQQLDNLVEPNDVVIGISCSGNSMNVINGLKLAKRVGAQTIAFTGFTGGQVGKIATTHCHVPSDNIEQVEDIHLMFEHLICTVLRERVELAVPHPGYISRRSVLIG